MMCASGFFADVILCVTYFVHHASVLQMGSNAMDDGAMQGVLQRAANRSDLVIS